MGILGDLVTVLIESEDCPHGQVKRIYEIRDSEGVLLRKQKITWSYYPTGEVDEIVTYELDPDDTVLSVKGIKHFTDGRQPISF